MGKRKASIFTVVESVDHWLDANCHIPVLLAADEGGLVHVNIGQGVTAQIHSNSTVAIPAEADRLAPLQVQSAAGTSYWLTADPRPEPPTGIAVLAGTGEAGIPLGQNSGRSGSGEGGYP